MATDAASSLVKFLLEPAPLEHLMHNLPAVEHHKSHQKELIAVLDARCTQLQQDARLDPERADLQLLINVEMAEELRKCIRSAILVYKSDNKIVIELGSHLVQATQRKPQVDSHPSVQHVFGLFNVNDPATKGH